MDKHGKLLRTFLIVGVCLLFGSTSVLQSEVDVQDEAEYLDHFIKASELSLAQAGDYLSQTSIEEICERGGQENHPSVPQNFDRECSAEDTKISFGINHSTPMPLYFVVTGILARWIQTILSVSNLGDFSIVTIGRLLGIAWYLIGSFFVFCAVSRLHGNLNILYPLLLGCAALPSVIHEHTIINADASSFALGAAVIYYSIRYKEKTATWISVVTACVVALLATSHNIFIVLSACTALLLTFVPGLENRRPQERSAFVQSGSRTVLLALLMVGIAWYLTSGWDNIRYSYVGNLVYGTPQTSPEYIGKVLRDTYASVGIRWYEIFSQENLMRFLIPSTDNFQPAQRIGGPYNSAVTFNVAILTTGLFGSILVARNRGNFRAWAAAHIVVSLALPILLIVNWNLQGVHDGVLGRFALSGLSIPIISCATLFSDNRTTRLVVWFSGVTLVALGLLTNFVDWV